MLSPIAMNTPAKAPKLLAYELQIDQARCQGSWGLIRDRLAGKHEKYSGKGVFRDFLIAEAALGDKFATFLKEHPDYDAIPTIVPRAADPKEFAKIRDSLLRVIEKSGSSGLLNLNFNLPGLKPSRSVPADTPAPAEPVIASGPVGGLPTISVRAPTEATGTARTTIEPPMPLDLVRQAHILLAKIDLLAKGDADAALTALGIANLPEDLPDTVSIATDGWTNGMKVLVAQGWVLRGLAYHLKSDFVSAFQCFDRVISWYCQKISPTAAALDPANASANGRALRTLTNASIGSLAAASADERSQPIPMVDIGTGTDQWAYWAEEASWRKTVQMIFKLGAASFPDGFYRDDDTQTTVTLHLNMFPPPSTKSGVKAKMLMRSRYVVPLRERIKYLITSMGGFAEQGTPSSLAGRTGKPSPVYGLSNGGRIRPNPNVMMNRVGTWEIEAQTLLASYEECVTGIHEFPKAIRDDREEARYKRVKECFEWMSMVCWESTDGDADEEEDERATWVPEIEKWRRGWLSVEVCGSIQVCVISS